MADNNRKQSNAGTNPGSPTTQQFPAPGVAKPPTTTLNPASPTMNPASPTSPTSPTFQDRRQSAEWDAAKVPPSRFQKRKGSIYAVPHSRDGRIDSNYAAKFHEKLAEMGYAKK